MFLLYCFTEPAMRILLNTHYTVQGYENQGARSRQGWDVHGAHRAGTEHHHGREKTQELVDVAGSAS